MLMRENLRKSTASSIRHFVIPTASQNESTSNDQSHARCGRTYQKHAWCAFLGELMCSSVHPYYIVKVATVVVVDTFPSKDSERSLAVVGALTSSVGVVFLAARRALW